MRQSTRRRQSTRTKRRTQKQCSWGYHLIVNAGNCDPVALRSKATIGAFAKDLVKKIDMVAFGEPRIVMFGSGNKKGYTLVQLIETSNITAHFVEETNDIYLDIFSCKAFKVRDALTCFRSYFKPAHVNTTFLKRQAQH
jgi:S-adenosylmethionine/arginine decarboxylase-like enzyme